MLQRQELNASVVLNQSTLVSNNLAEIAYSAKNVGNTINKVSL
jgi:hypothetical protein